MPRVKGGTPSESPAGNGYGLDGVNTGELRDLDAERTERHTANPAARFFLVFFKPSMIRDHDTGRGLRPKPQTETEADMKFSTTSRARTDRRKATRAVSNPSSSRFCF